MVLSNSNGLDGLSVLIVEDEYFVATELAMALEDAGARVAKPVSNIDDAELAIEEEVRLFDVVILDVNLGGEMIFDLADRLLQRRVPLIFATGYQCDSLPERFRHIPCLGKPCDDSEIIRMVMTLCGRTVAGSPRA